MTPDQLSLIIAGLELLIDRHQLKPTGKSVKLLQAMRSELQYQQLASPLIEEHDRILTRPTLSPADEERLGEINRELADLSVDRPSEFGGRFSAEDAIGTH